MSDPEFELGELAGSIANLLLMAKPLFKFHSHKSTYFSLLFFSFLGDWLMLTRLVAGRVGG
jgi:hypothetical protein